MMKSKTLMLLKIVLACGLCLGVIVGGVKLVQMLF